MFLRTNLIGPIVALSFVLAGDALRIPDRSEKSFCGWNPVEPHPSAKKVWDKMAGGVIGDEFINEHGVAHWVQNLDNDLWNQTTDHWSCLGYGDTCSLEKECEDYRAIGKEGAYWLYYSIQQARSFLDNCHEYLQDNTFDEILSMPQIISDFARTNPPTPGSPFGLLGAGLGMVSSMTGASAAVSGTMGALSGLAGIVANLAPAAEEPDDDFGIRLSKRIQDAFDQANEQLDNIAGALFGAEGYDQDLIPEAMRKQSFNNIVIDAFGDGQWLIDDPNDGLKEHFETMYQQMKQGLAWMVMRYSQDAVVVINTDVSSDDCSSQDPDAVWDDELGVCFNLFQRDGDNYFTDVGHDLADVLWDNEGDYNLDRLITYRNAYDCWIANDGKAGDPVPNEDPSDSSLPQCFFSAIVIKGSYNVEEGGYVTADDFPGWTEGDEYSIDAILWSQEHDDE